MLVVLTLGWLVWLAWWLVAPDRNPGGQCEGLGFGCTPTPKDVATFAGIVGLAPLTALVLAVTLVIRLVRIRKGSPRTAWDVVVGVLVLAAFGLWLAGTVAGAV